MTWAASTSGRPRQKKGAWTKRKLRRLRVQRELERGIDRAQDRRDQRALARSAPRM